MSHKKKETPEEIQVALKTIIDYFDKEEQSVRERQIRLWKKLEFYWSGFTNIWWSEVNHDWRIYDNYADGESDYYDKQINVFRAYLESIIAALSSTVPPVRCKPDDADNPSDISTAKGGTKIAELVYEHIDARLLWCKALFVYCTQGMVAAYNYTVEDEKFGTVQVAEYDDVEEEVENKYCPICGMMFDEATLSAAMGLRQLEEDEFDPNHPELASLSEQGVLCPTCSLMVDPEPRLDRVIITRQVGVINKPKARQMIEVNGGLYVKVPNWARAQKDIPYLSYCYETHFTNVYAKYGDDLRDKFKFNDTRITSSSGNEAYERWGRLSPQYYGEYPMDTPTVRNWWLRPSVFEMIDDEEVRKDLYKRFPSGCKTVFINDVFAEACDENLDDHWTITRNPLSEYIHYDPLGLLLTSVQDITTDLVSLILQTIEHGIPTTFADPSVLSFDGYRHAEAKPGMVIPAKAKGGKALGDGFFTLKTTTLSGEVMPFGEKINEMGQFVSGALPSLFGGDAGNSSRTAAQYSMSRSQALQRLQTPWKMINSWWKDIFGKVIPAYMKNMLEDERIVKEEHNSFVNVVIKKAQLDGKLGSVTLESSDELPQSWMQVRDTLMNLIATNNPQILEAIGDPINLHTLRQAIGLNDFSIPGEADREKQYEEIQVLLKSEPILVPMSMGPMGEVIPEQEMPSVMPDPDVDNHMVEAAICRDYLVSETGRQAKIENETGYRNILLHMKMHQMMMAPPAMPQPEGDPSSQEETLRPVE